MQIFIYGIKNCNSMKKAFEQLDAKGQPYTFHDYKKLGIDALTLSKWLEHVPLDVLLNKKGTTWRKLTPAQQQLAVTPQGAIQLMSEYPSLIKRPVIAQLNDQGDIVRLAAGLSQDPLP